MKSDAFGTYTTSTPVTVPASTCTSQRCCFRLGMASSKNKLRCQKQRHGWLCAGGRQWMIRAEHGAAIQALIHYVSCNIFQNHWLEINLTHPSVRMSEQKQNLPVSGRCLIRSFPRTFFSVQQSSSHIVISVINIIKIVINRCFRPTQL